MRKSDHIFVARERVWLACAHSVRRHGAGRAAFAGSADCAGSALCAVTYTCLVRVGAARTAGAARSLAVRRDLLALQPYMRGGGRRR